ncbi:hypothetical protein DMH25_08250 [Streptomyces sp. WAC 01325]|uniref:hypothetical protein n=1 Tax=Streptomyces sp. WAC 01325 TaxID=2203202 RepID=UPI000F88C2D8|nr:hypothetical protein [Streptomyces sp. WAC 01325]RSN13769.1 hypothetical protein DMH25_08250 [Streptomyces sp. WAC 01325]
MAEFTRRTITTIRAEFVIPAGPYGAAAAEIGKAWSVAEREYRAVYGLMENDSVPDNAIVFRPGDDEIVISFETKGPQS